MKFSIWKKKNPDRSKLDGTTLEGVLDGRKVGTPIRSGTLSMIPLFGAPGEAGRFAPPQSALSLSKVTHYGQMSLANSADRPTIVPLHLGYLQQGAQNHAMCRTWVLGPKGEEHFKDACCVQAAQGGYIKDSEDRFIILPHSLRPKALSLRGEVNYGKLWNGISEFNKQIGLKARGHLDELKQARQPVLLRTKHIFEQQAGQTGAIFLVGGEIAGIELAPDAEYWAELAPPLVMYCYAPLVFFDVEASDAMQLDIDGLETLEHLEARLSALFEARRAQAADRLTALAKLPLEVSERDVVAGHTVAYAEAGDFVGQVVADGRDVVYASLSNRALHAVH